MNATFLDRQAACIERVVQAFRDAGERVTTRLDESHDVAVVGISWLEDAASVIAPCEVPVIVLGSWSDAQDVADVLNAGAADYVTLPAEAVIVAKVRALRRRLAWSGQDERRREPIVEGNGLYIDYDQRLVRVDRREVHLPKREWEVLHALVHAPHGMTKDQLLREVWRRERMAWCDSVLATYVCYLRRKIGKGRIVTVGGGRSNATYRLVLKAS